MAEKKRTSHVCKVDEKQIEKLHAYLNERGWEFCAMQYAHWKATKDKTNIVAYNSGKLTVQGKGTEEFVLFVLEPEILKTSGFGYDEFSASESPEEAFFPHGGVDESGKGDFFGPLVIAGVFVDEETEPLLRKLGVKDSKVIKNPKQIKAIALKIRQAVGSKFSVVAIGPAAYNRLYGDFNNLNKLLAWGHAKVIETLLEKAPECNDVLSDKFAAEHLIKNALQERGRTINMRQKTKAESDIAVAAASILARDRFLWAMENLSKDAGLELPKGAGAKVSQIAEKIAREQGIESLDNLVKLHFKTYKEICDRIK
ncbi:MAG: ribonuclease HIII [Victivallales bacterium]|nr:ribonuclease HIII [Victivallales bacterium]